MMTTLLIDSNSLQAQSFLNFARTLPFVKTVAETKDFHQAVAACNATSVDAFFDEIDNRIKKHFETCKLKKNTLSLRHLSKKYK